MAGIELVSADYEIEASINFVRGEYVDEFSPGVDQYDRRTIVPSTNLEEIPQHIGQLKIEELAWVSFFKRAIVTIKHPHDLMVRVNDQGKPISSMIPEYPEETLVGERTTLGETQLATDRSGDEVEFTPLSQILVAQRITPYTAGWFSKIAVTNNYPSFHHRLIPLFERYREF